MKLNVRKFILWGFWSDIRKFAPTKISPPYGIVFIPLGDYILANPGSANIPRLFPFSHLSGCANELNVCSTSILSNSLVRMKYTML